jgi:hypothetical protein
MSAPAFVILIVCLASIALADDFKTIDGKEYKNVTVSRVEPDGIVLINKSGISKVYFTELPKEVQQRFNYVPEKAAAYSAEQNAASEQLRKQRAELNRQVEERNKQYWTNHPRATSHVPPRDGDTLDWPTVEQLNLHWVHRGMNGMIIFGLAPDGATVGPSVGRSTLPMGPDIKRSFAEELRLELAGELPTRRGAAIAAEQQEVAAEQKREAAQQQFDEQRRQGEQSQHDIANRARHEVEQLELKQAYEGPLSTSDEAFYKNSLGNEIHQSGDSSLESRFQEVIRKSEEQRRQQDELSRP